MCERIGAVHLDMTSIFLSKDRMLRRCSTTESKIIPSKSRNFTHVGLWYIKTVTRVQYNIVYINMEVCVDAAHAWCIGGNKLLGMHSLQTLARASSERSNLDDISLGTDECDAAILPVHQHLSSEIFTQQVLQHHAS